MKKKREHGFRHHTQRQFMAHVRRAWIEKPLENRMIFMKTEKTGRDWFYCFLENQTVKFDIFINLK
jgi:hypothetical protein